MNGVAQSVAVSILRPRFPMMMTIFKFCLLATLLSAPATLAADPEVLPASIFTVAENGSGICMQIRAADLDGNGTGDIVCAGKSGTHILWNEGR